MTVYVKRQPATRSIEVRSNTAQGVGRQRQRRQEIVLGYLMLAPALLVLLVFEVFPIFSGLYISLCNWQIRCIRLVGAENYLRALHDPEMWHALWITPSTRCWPSRCSWALAS